MSGFKLMTLRNNGGKEGPGPKKRCFWKQKGYLRVCLRVIPILLPGAAGITEAEGENLDDCVAANLKRNSGGTILKYFLQSTFLPVS